MIDYAARRKQVQAAMAARGTDLLAVWPDVNMYYLLGFHPHPDERPCYFLLTQDREGFLCPELNATQVRAHVDVPLVATYTDAEGPHAALGHLATALGFENVRKVAIDETMRADFVLLLLEQLPTARPVVATELLGPLRMRKEPVEIDLIEMNHAIADRAMRAAFSAIRPGMTEQRLADVVRATFGEEGADRVNFAIIGAGPNGAFPHHHTSSRVIQEGDAVVIDIGARKQGYNSDITRMAFVGEAPEEYLKVHEVVEEAVKAALAAVRPGVPACAIDKAARDVITRSGYGQYFTHRTGHGLGLNGHEPPYITGTNQQLLEEGMVFSIEPGIYLPGKFGVRLEEIVVVTASGARIFSKLSREVFRAKP